MNTVFKLLFIASSVMMLQSCLKEDDASIKIPPITGAVVEPNIGGERESNQVWIDLASNTSTVTHREDWDLGFYCGDDFRVILNSSLMMAVGKIENVQDINRVNSRTVADLMPLVHVANFQDNSLYIDDPKGDLKNQKTAISEIKLNDVENNVYLLNMGYKTYPESSTTLPGSVYTMGDARGWKKIRILRDAHHYKLQYADLDATSYTEFTIAKDNQYNFRFFSFASGNYKEIQPKKKKWDLCFSVFTNLTSNGKFLTSYVYPDFILNNSLANVSVYEVSTALGQGETAYNLFTLDDIDAKKFVLNDQTLIGSNWRTTTGNNGVEVHSNKFYVLKNSEGLFFKLRFLRMKNEKGFRGYPQFEYKAL